MASTFYRYRTFNLQNKIKKKSLKTDLIRHYEVGWLLTEEVSGLMSRGQTKICLFFFFFLFYSFVENVLALH